MEKIQKNNDALLLRLPAELKTELQKQADANGRRITAEINTRLRVSLAARGPTLQAILSREAQSNGIITNPPSYVEGPTLGLTANDNGPPAGFSDLDQAMLQIFKAMPVEKQLALLSLFK